MSGIAAEGMRVAAVVAMLAVAAALAAPPGRLPPALRGLSRLLRSGAAAPEGRVPRWKKAAALLLVSAAAALCCL